MGERSGDYEQNERANSDNSGYYFWIITDNRCYAATPPTATHASSYAVYANGTPTPDSGIALNTLCTIYWTGVVPANTGTFNIIIYDPNGNIVTTYYDVPPSQSGQITFIANQPGYWTVEFDGASTVIVKSGIYAYPSVFVLPESVIGGLAALGAGACCFWNGKALHKT